MKLALSIFARSILEKIVATPFLIEKIDKFLIYTKYLSKYGNYEFQEIDLKNIPLAKRVLVWDVLVDDDELKRHAKIFSRFATFVSAVRFQDPGVGLFLLKTYPSVFLELNLERFSHNIYAILHWEKIFQPNLQKIILSNLTPLKTIQAWQTKLSTCVEILGVGRQEIFYSPRMLLARQSKKTIFIESTDRLGAWNQLVQTHSGVVMYNAKDICILSYLKEITEAKIAYIRLDPSSLTQLSWIKKALVSSAGLSSLAKFWKREHLVGFLKANKTSAQFAMLKNKYLYPKEKNLIKVGKLVESKKNDYSLLSLCGTILLPCSIFIYSPEKKIVKLELKTLQNIQKQQVSSASDGYYFTSYIPKIAPNSLIYRQTR